MAMQTKNGQFTQIPVFNALIPNEGPKAVPLVFDFTMQSSYSVDLTNTQALGVISNVQTIFVDNSANAGALTILVNQVQQTIICPPGAQGYFPVLAPNPIKLFVSCSSGIASTVLFLVNVPLPAGVWSVAGSGNTYSTGKLLVSDQALETAVVSGQMQSLQYLTGTAGVSYPQWMGNATVTGSITNTASAVISGSPGYFLTGGSVMLSAGAVRAAAGDLTVTLTDSASGAIWTLAFFVPAAAPTLTQATTISAQLPSGFLWNNKTANSTLAVTLGAALTTGKIFYNLNYGITSQVG